ncbi:MAG: hypothetical protein A2504_10370 [Bdellovibrionales bacterium RIFOXYD12_FULL_39_22]|nr:MAG: hypothetical protein A2385_16985 [Bdellovibrionales bacterium RIFOXYB1_FULL_39_21]OFZ44116.1 MAG: hypothetical protein A2485_14255 [Bdellovibrionales bacterium RIFOXYC12_FULL_39_17]OFZ48650.1 MAG: hypothetical protein A2404_08190 [Bdellovibrionales bacterium RIFOXYC1_FULL_39_130]OFZ76764.1 MAG: hypothetical protein A2560_10480 [Bdellovibrionales bacterium RIFOXYD1_FULL_39_84]OFZ95067.1 MAG: hypothetical protein A2504_10370 [Bdellovibrionales bacterium RIFOXYD12_FULL_39_22]HLE11006.1 AT
MAYKKTKGLVMNLSGTENQNQANLNFSRDALLRRNDGSFFKLDNVSYSYGSVKALSQVSLAIGRGEIVFVTGSSGAGKSTLLKVLKEELLPSSGKVFLPKFLNSQIFISGVEQESDLLGDFSCHDNMALAYDPTIYRRKKDFNNDLQDLAKYIGITDKLDLKINRCNGGLRQKVAIARALLARPDVFIADEPTSSLDYDSSKKIFDILNVYNIKRGMTIVWASHNRELVKRFTGRIIHLDNGKIIYSGHACFI